MKSLKGLYLILIALLLLLFCANILFGSVTVPFKSILELLLNGGDNQIYSTIILESRFPQAITALLAGSGLALSGLLLQTLFGNPMADPSILGVSSGASLGVAIVMLMLGGAVASLGLAGNLAILSGALIGSSLVLAILLLFSVKLRNSVMLLIVGIMVGYVAGSAVSLLSYLSSSDGVFTFVMWGLGDFSSIPLSSLGYFASVVIGGILFSYTIIKPLNGLLLGERYCQNLGINISATRTKILITAGLLTSVITAYCGPISFLGLAVPHVARLLSGSSNHRQLLPLTVICGAVLSLLCNLISTTMGNGVIIPLNVITPCLGAPVIIYVIINRDKIAYFNN